MEAFGILGFLLAGFCYFRIDALEKKLKEMSVLDKDFDSKNEVDK
ncbi:MULTISPECIES: hypothetical protein [unclassified Marinobacter]|nr:MULTISPECIES: hypothetical protein [unclassified Marinobacter]MDO6441149.1 hypothetical protein [Marinobacter sp. 2_MG-2023]MDO6825424.1 hypothetical protein [Marinobacter sp. 1_MG-2023]